MNFNGHSNFDGHFEPCAQGREHIPDFNGGIPFDLYREDFTNKNKQHDNSLSGIHEKNDLNGAFFAQKNVELLQQLIQAKVLQKSSGKFQIGKQSEKELVIIMRSIYLQHGKNLPDNIQQQVDELNVKVVDECVRIILINIQSYIGYVKDVNAPPSVMVMPKSTRITNNTLQMNIGFTKFQQ